MNALGMGEWMDSPKGNAMSELRDKEGRTPGQIARAVWSEAVGLVITWDPASDCIAEWEKAAQAVLDAFGAQVSRQMLMDAWIAGWDALDIGSGQYDPAKYTDSINLAPERAPLPYTAKEVADAVLSAWCNPHGVPPQPGRIDPHGYKAAIAVAAKFCAPKSEPTLDEIHAMAAKHGMVLRPAYVLGPTYELGPPIRPLSKDAQDGRKPLSPDVLADAPQDAGRARPAKSAPSLTAALTVPDARFGSGK